jgi:hypothetical protein
MFRPASCPRFLSTATLLIVTTVTIVGCRSGGSETLTRDAFLEQGNAICAKGNAEIAAAIAQDGSGGPPSGAAGEALFKSVMDASRRMIDEVGALKPPPDLQPEMTGIVSDSRIVLADLESKGAEAMFASEEDPFAEINKRLTAIGLTVCGEDPGSPK